MEQVKNSVLVQVATLADIEAIVSMTIDRRIKEFYDRIRSQPPVLIKRKEAAKILGVSLPTLDTYGKFGILHPKHVGGRVFYQEDELLAKKGR